MKKVLFILMFCFANLSLAQEVEEEFLPIVIEDKEAYMSTKTGEYVYLEHAKTDPEQLRTTASGVVYNDISTHKVSKGETLSSIAKKHNLSIDQLKRDNKLTSNKLSLGQEIKIINRVLVTSSSPVISYSGDDTIIAKLRPGQSPSTMAPPPSSANTVPVTVTTPAKTESPEARKAVTRKSTYSRPMVLPTATTETTTTEVEEVKEVVVEEESPEVIAARKQLEEAQRQLALAKKKSVKKEVKPEDKVLETKKETVKDLVEVVEKTEEIKAKEDVLQAKLDKVKSATPKKEVVKEEVIQEEVVAKTPIKEEAEVEVDTSEDAKAEAKEATEGVDYHTIVKGDNLYNLAKKYKTTVKKLTELNNVKFNNLQIGQKLKLK